MTALPISVVATFCLVLACAGPAIAADVEGQKKQHALSLVGAPGYGADFKHFDWINPDAPKGGTVRQWSMGTFDSLNPFTIKGNVAVGATLVYDTLMSTSADEAGTEYVLVAEWVSHPEDRSSVTFGLRANARFHDGKPITPEDVIFSLEILKKTHPFYGAYYKNVVKVEKTGEREVTFRFDQKGNRELPQIVGQLYVLPKHYWEGKGADGEPRDLSKTTLEIPLGSGPYRIREVEAGRSIVYERVKDWWAKDLPVSKGQWNFDELKFLYFRDRVPAFEAFKVGDLDFWRESSAKFWATAYDFDAATKGLVKKERIPLVSVAPMQGFVMNLRRKQFQDARVRRAFNLAFDFEWANKNLFYDQYVRVGSYFGGSDFEAKGLPQGRELELLKEVAKDIPPEVFAAEWKNPVYKVPEDERNNLRQAAQLFGAAGWTSKAGGLTDAKGEPFTVEFLLDDPNFERIVLPFKANLEKLGIKVTVRVVDSAQYRRREDTFDFDIVVDNFRQSESPGNEQRDFWGSAAADREGSRNTIGIKNPAIDKLIDNVVFAKNREDLVAATRALDRVLLWNHYVVPQWHTPYDRIAVWTMFGRPAKLPARATSFTRVWWFDAEAQKKLAAARGK
ncbi:MAG: extracellular solute-binding protein [Hyphomicrobiaceae bacterium]